MLPILFCFFYRYSPLIYLACVCARTRARDVIILLPSTTFCSNMQRFKSIWCGRCWAIDHRLTTIRPSLEQLSNRQLGHREKQQRERLLTFPFVCIWYDDAVYCCLLLSMALIFSRTNCTWSFNFCTFLFISSMSEFPFLDDALRKPRLFS